MKILKYSPTTFDSCAEDVSARISQYITNNNFTVTRGDGAVATVEFENDIDHQNLLLVDSAMISLGYYRQ